jgi:hypothetical protein
MNMSVGSHSPGVKGVCADNDRILEAITGDAGAKCSYYKSMCSNPEALKICPYSCGVCRWVHCVERIRFF